jgi:hypothetical protein
MLWENKWRDAQAQEYCMHFMKGAEPVTLVGLLSSLYTRMVLNGKNKVKGRREVMS